MKVYSSYDLDVLLTKQLSNETWEDGSFFLADFTGNGLTDLIWVSKINSDACGFRFFLSESPDSPFSKIVTMSLGDVGLIKEIIVGDFAGNRRSEVILMYEVYGETRTRIVRLTDPDNNVSVTTPNINMADIIPASGNRKVLIGDFNADAKSDILLLNTSVVSMLLCRLSRSNFFSNQKRNSAHSLSYVKDLFCRVGEKEQDLGRLK